MNRISRLLLGFTLLLGGHTSLSAQTLADPDAGIEHLYGDLYSLKWYGSPGYTYFIQTANTLNGSQDDLAWEFLPDIRAGVDSLIGVGFEVPENPETRLYRLIYTDIPVADHNLGDFDGDGVINLQEAMDNTDPFDASSNANTTGGGNNGGSSNGSGNGNSQGNTFQLIHIIDGESTTYTIDEQNPVPSLVVARENGSPTNPHLTEVKLVNAPGDTRVAFLYLEPNDDYDWNLPEGPNNPPYSDIRVVELTSDAGGSIQTFTGPTEWGTFLDGVLLPLDRAPEVLDVNSDFDEGRIDPNTHHAIPDCDDVPGVDQ